MIMAEIILTQGKTAIVDEADFEWLSQWKWYFWKGRNGNGYAIRKDNLGIVDGIRKWDIFRMHRVIMSAPSNMQVDHINVNPLDNRRENLRLCTHRENTYNKKKSRGSSKYKGVSWKRDNNKWQAAIRCGLETHYLGLFSSQESAAAAYNEAAIKYFGEFAGLNEVRNAA